MRLISILLLTGLVAPFLGCKAAGKRSSAGLESSDAGNGSLAVRDRWSFTDAELEKHEALIQSKLPGGVYLVKFNGQPMEFYRRHPSPGDPNTCDDLYKAVQSGKDPNGYISGMEKGFATDFGFNKCKLAPFYKGIMPLRKCVQAVECTGKGIHSGGGEYVISMLYNFDYKTDDETGGSNSDCTTHLDDGQFKINGKTAGAVIGDDSGYNFIVEFAAKGNAESTAKGCLVTVSH